jgi:hypothetical protein
MGDLRREDSAKAKKDVADDRIDRHEQDHEDFDTSHANKQLAARPQARGELHPDYPEHMFEGVGDQDRLWSDFDTLLETKTVSERALPMVRNMNGENRAKTGARLTEVARVTTGADLLVIAELASALPGVAVDAALTCDTKPTVAQMRAFLMRVDADDLKNQIGDAETVAKLRGAYPGSAIAVLPRLPELLDNEDLARWYVHDTPSEQIAMAMTRIHDKATAVATAKKLDKLGRTGWLWAFHVTDAITALNADAIEIYAKHSAQADIAAFLQQKFDHYNTTFAAMAATEKDLQRELGQAKPDAEHVVDDLGVVVGLADSDLRKPGNRRRFLAVASTRQIDQATQLAALPPAERLDWLFEGAKVTVDELRDVLAAWPDNELASGIETRHVSAIRKRWNAARPAEVFGRVPADLYGRLGDSTDTRTWIVGGEPNEILEWLAFRPGSTAARCTWIATHGGWAWLDRIGGGIDDHALRVVALHCPDKTISDKIQKQLLGDHIDSESIQQHGEAISSTATENPNDRFTRESGFKKNRDLADLAGELRAQDIAQLQRDPAAMQKTLANTKGRALARVLYLLDPPLVMLLQRSTEVEKDENEVALISGWVRTRPGDDVVAAFSDATAFARAQKLWPSAPLEILPQLRQPAVLSRVLDANPDVLAWIIENSEPMSMLHAIAASGVIKSTVAALEDQTSLVENLPSGQRLSPRERTYLYGLANNAQGSLKQKLMHRVESKDSDEDSPITDRAVGETRKGLDKAGFAGALKMLVEDVTSPIEDIFTLCREHEAEAANLVTQSGELAVLALQRTGSSPQVLFPTVPYDLLFGDPFLAEATFESVPGFVLLRAVATNDRLAMRLALGIEGHASQENKATTSKNPGYLPWLHRLPAAASMSAAEHAALKKILAHTQNDLGAGEVFKARFGSPVGASYTKAEVVKLWTTLERLPPAHVQELAVSGFREFKAGTRPYEGVYAPGDRGISIEEGMIDKKTENPVYDRTDEASTKMSRDDVKRAFQLDDKQVDQWVHDGRLAREGDAYTVTAKSQPDRFTGTALHEVGHAVDAMLGSNTELVYKMADWHQFGDADFDAWATELGGWDRVAPEDKKQIREAWTMWANSSQGAGRPAKELESLLGDQHPARDTKKYGGVGVIDFGMDPDGRGHSGAPFIRNGRAFMMHGAYQQRYSIPLTTMHVSPSVYSLTAPAEWFAECYMTYYLTYDGTPKTSGEKGKLLAPWIKKWFEEHIDKVGHNPMRGHEY